MAHQQRRPAAEAEDIKKRVTRCMIKLSDRDTEPMAAAELDSIARTLPASSLPHFLSALSDARPSDRPALRRHSLRLLSLLSASPLPLRPHHPKISSLLLPRLRDPDSSVRAALLDAVRSLSLSDPASFAASSLFRPLSDSLLHEQEASAQAASALCLSAAIDSSDASPDLLQQIQRLLPRLLKLARSSAFKAKPALASLLGSAGAAGAAGGESALAALVACLAEFLSSEDWAARKAAAEALTRIGAAERDALSGQKEACVARFEARRFDKVKIVRESMNKMLEVWRDLPGDAATAATDHSNSRRESTGSTASVPRKSKTTTTTSRSPPPIATPTTTRKKSTPTNERKVAHTPMTPKTDPEIAVSPPSEERGEKGKEGNGRSRFEVKKMVLKEDRGLKSGSRVVPFEESGDSEIVSGSDNVVEDHHGDGVGDGDLSLIRKQLVQIENQQSSLIDLLQRFIGSSQNGIRSLETRVHGLEMALDEISRDLAVSYGIMSKNIDPEVKTCCSLPGAEFLSSRFRKKEGGRYSLSGSPTLSGMRYLAEKQGGDSYRQRVGLQSGFVVNPLAEINTQSRGNTEVTPKKMLKNVTLELNRI
ncbi:putative microtubule-associated protein TORTIFOLIA1 [Iris pallida]|uniref:Microtubule-associated protein TORTIFOLIA1 n=1 Tax=Iris pallida TaxID=29817 RepID=A0AAX6IAP8_IRIPA|nr:putative microtubule-associated protein TORTIFOLIA1 [Iris pallida]